MAKPPRSSVEIDDFPGLMDNADPKDIPAGAAVSQINATAHRAGELVVRGGYRYVTFEND